MPPNALLVLHTHGLLEFDRDPVDGEIARRAVVEEQFARRPSKLAQQAIFVEVLAGGRPQPSVQNSISGRDKQDTI